MTKEMRPAHCLDILAHALLYHGYMRKQNLGTCITGCAHKVITYNIAANLLVQRWKKAKGIRDIAIEKFSRLSSLSPGLLLIDKRAILCSWFSHSIDY